MSGKRPYEGGDDGDSKRIRSNNGSPAPASNPATATATATSATGSGDVDPKRAAALARIAAIKARMAGGGAAPAPAQAVPPPPPPAAVPSRPAPPANGSGNSAQAAALQKIKELAAKNAALRKGGASPATGGQGAPPAQQQQEPSEKELRIAEARRKAAELAKQRTSAPTPPGPPPRQDARGARGGLGIGLHPSLMGETATTTKPTGKQGPKFSTTKGNQQPAAVKVNPYIAAGDGEAKPEHFDDEIYDPTITSRRGGERKTRDLIFNQKGKFIAQANALKQQAKIEEMKRRIAIDARKTEIEEAGDKAFLVAAPPEVEWWDEGLLPPNQNSYENWEQDDRNRIASDASIITAYIQHPVLLAAPQDKLAPAAKPMMLTTKEQKKLRRQRRMADMKETQAKVRLGLIEPPAPKVKKSNMMRVLGEQAVKDPTAVEARVNREIAARKNEHETANADRKLTKEQRHAKLEKQKEEDAKKGIHCAVFRVDNLSSGKHRYRVDKNAKDGGLHGIVVLHPSMNLVIVEGGAHAINFYKKLMLNRVKWDENTLPISNTPPTTFVNSNSNPSAVSSAETTGASRAKDTWLNPLDESGNLKDLATNKCQLVWEGEEREMKFKKWSSRVCETDGEAREVLRRTGMENMWTLARSLGAGQEFS